jgi:uncharacterized protein (DUF924 family)
VGGRFGELPERALAGELDAWNAQPRSALARVLVLDQFPRNLYRGTAQCFQYDPRACEVAVMALERGYDSELTPLEATFLYLPLEHAEDISTQDRCVSLFRRLLDRAAVGLRPQFENFLAFAIRHREVIDRFGRFPHRNAALGRPTTNNERSFLESGGDTFGGATARPDRKP